MLSQCMVTLTLIHTESSRIYIFRPYLVHIFYFQGTHFFHATLILMHETPKIGPDISWFLFVFLNSYGLCLCFLGRYNSVVEEWTVFHVVRSIVSSSVIAYRRSCVYFNSISHNLNSLVSLKVNQTFWNV